MIPMAARKTATSGEHQQPDMVSGDSAVCLVFGDDEYVVSTKVRQIVEQLCPPEDQALGLEIVEGQVDTVAEAVTAVAQCLEGLQTVGFFGGRKVVWLRNAHFFSDTVIGRTQDVKGRLEKLTAEIKRGLADGQYLVVSSPKVDKRSAFYKACKAAGTVLEYETPAKSYQAEQQARERAQTLLGRAGLSMDERLVQYFVERTGTDTRQIVQEVEKLSLYLGKGPVRREDVDAVVSLSREAIRWSFADAVGQRDLPGALFVLRQLLSQKESPIGLVMALENRFRELMVLRVCMDRNWMQLKASGNWATVEWGGDGEMDALLGGLPKDPRELNPYRAAMLAKQARNFGQTEIARAQARILQAHETLVSSGLPKDLLLEILVIELLGRPQRGVAQA